MAIQYQVFANTAAGDPVDYATPIATVATTTYTTAPLTPGGSHRFAVRALDSTTGLVDQNLDCALAIELDSLGNDVSSRPRAPVGLRAFALAGGGVRVEWSWLGVASAWAPLGFYVYLTTAPPLSYTTPQATVPYASGWSSYGVTLTGQADGSVCTIGVRAYNAAGAEQNTTATVATAAAIGPTPVDALTAVAG